MSIFFANYPSEVHSMIVKAKGTILAICGMLIVNLLMSPLAEAHDQINKDAISTSQTRTIGRSGEKLLAYELAEVRSKHDLDRYLTLTPIRMSPLRYLTESSRKIFWKVSFSTKMDW